MNRKQLAILLVLVAVIGGIGIFLQKTNRGQWSATSNPAGGKVVDFPINDVARVEIHSASGQVDLTKKNDAWVVEERADYPANFSQVSTLIRRLWELKPVQEVKVGQSQLSRLELVQPGQGDGAGTLVELKDKDGKNLAKIVAGKKGVRKTEGLPGGMAGVPAGRYILPVSSGKVSLVSESLDELNPNPESWLKRDFIKIDDPESITLAGQTTPRHWTITHTKGNTNWRFADAKPNEQIDPGKVSSLISVLSSLSFTDVLPSDAKPQETGLDKPDLLTIQTFDRFTYTIKIGKLSGQNYPVAVSVNVNLVKERTPAPDEKPEDKAKLDQEFQIHLKGLEEKAAAEKEYGKRIYLIANSSLDALLTDRTALVAAKTPTPSPSPNRRR
jgi:hypothetical protein